MNTTKPRQGNILLSLFLIGVVACVCAMLTTTYRITYKNGMARGACTYAAFQQVESGMLPEGHAICTATLHPTNHGSYITAVTIKPE